MGAKPLRLRFASFEAVAPLVATLRASMVLGEVNDNLRRWGVSIEAVVGDGRSSHVARVRHWVTWVLRDVAGLSYPQIGALVRRDSSTILAGVRLAKSRQMAPLPRPRTAIEAAVDEAVRDDRARIVMMIEARAWRADLPARDELLFAADLVREGSFADPLKWFPKKG